jgi:hypothetical protein
VLGKVKGIITKLGHTTLGVCPASAQLILTADVKKSFKSFSHSDHHHGLFIQLVIK